MLKQWLRSGLRSNRIIGYAPVNVHSLDALRRAIAYFGGVYVGIQVPTNRSGSSAPGSRGPSRPAGSGSGSRAATPSRSWAKTTSTCTP